MPRQLKNNGWISVPWEEYVGHDASHGATWASGWNDDNSAVFNILVNWQDGLEAEIGILGFAVWDDSAQLLRRTLPVRHPYKRWMVAERLLSATPVRWDSKLQQYVTGFNSLAGSPISGYSYWLLSIGFVNPRYRVIDDTTLINLFGSPPQEWRRFCEVTHRISEITLSREAGQSFFWADSTGNASGAVPPILNKPFPANLGQTFLRDEIHVKWRRIPRRGLFGAKGESDFYNQNILNNWGKVNSTTTLFSMPGNSQSGVLRFVSADPVPIPSPFDPLIQQLLSTSINQYYDVDMVFVWQDPPAGNTNANPALGFRGHNLAPNPADNYWYLVSTGQVLNTGDVTAATNASPIVLTVPGWTTQPPVNSWVTVSGVLGNTAANGTWLVSAATATTVTLQNTAGNGAFTPSPGSKVMQGSVSGAPVGQGIFKTADISQVFTLSLT